MKSIMSGSPEKFRHASKHHERALLVLWGEVQSDKIDEAALNDWWTNEHLPERLSIPGFVRARRYCARDGSANNTKYLTLYDVDNLGVLTSTAYMDKLDHPTAGTRKHIPTLATMHRSACRIISHHTRPELQPCGWTVGSTIVMIIADFPDKDKVESWAESAISTISTQQSSEKSLMSCTILQEDPEYTAPGSSSQSYSNITLRKSDAGSVKVIALVEFSNPVWLSHPVDGVVTSILRTLAPQMSKQTEVDSVTYKLMCSVTE